MIKRLFIFLIFAVAATSALKAQTMMLVELTDGTTNEYLVDRTGGIYLDSAVVRIRESRIAPESMIMVEQIARITFTESTNQSIEDVNGEKFYIFPNPASECVTVASPCDKAQELRIYSMDGRLMMCKSCGNGDVVDVSGLPRGLYIVCQNEFRTKLIKK